MTKYYIVYTAEDKSEGVVFENHHDAVFAAGLRTHESSESALADTVHNDYAEGGVEPLEVEEIEIKENKND